MTRAVAYYRKSNEDKEVSIAQQKEWAERVCTRERLTVVAEFQDQAVSGLDTARRTGFLAMIEFCEQQAKLGRPVKAVVCWHANRFSRANSLETSAYLFRLVQAGVSKMLTDAKWIDFNRSEDRMIFGLEQEATSHRFSVDLSAATIRGKRARAAKGLWTGGAVPYGYRVEGGKFAIDPPAAEVVRLIFDTYAAGRHGLQAVGEMLADRGIPSPKGGRVWSPPTISGILRNPVYLGHLVSGRRTESRFVGEVNVPAGGIGKGAKVRHRPQDEWTVSENAHPAILPQELFDRVQARLATNRKRTSPNKSYVLSGLAKCGGCGGPMIGHTFNGYRYLVCGRYVQFGRKAGCHMNAVREDRLVTAVARKLKQAYFNPAFMSELREEIRRQEQTPDAPSRVKQLTVRIEELKRKVEAGMRRLIDLPAELSADFEAALLQTRREQTRLEKELKVVEAAEVPAEDLDAGVDAILARMDQLEELMVADPHGANVVLREMIDRVVLRFDHTERKSRTRSRFARGAIFLSEASCLGSSDSEGARVRC